ncbi:hypothetical protein M8C21_002957 [Ambrosia artemisiifolia]|uniref:Uncharacterized protein n=1 Tax=Ambrosia artemisiifolia TaxID=4212 RepID=A0AAD5G9N8_AMBAR|nr:hypothetical protein M8C21_002957 [Ambrosia artemisiifolia]
MEQDLDQDQQTKSLLDNNHDHHHKGGIKTMPFIIVNEAFEKVASYGLLPNMILYLTQVYHLQAVTGSSLTPSSSNDPGTSCNLATPTQLAVLFSSFGLMYYASVSMSTFIAFSVVVYIQDQFGWRVGFAVPVSIMACSAVVFLIGSPLYVKVKESPYSGFIQVMVMAFKNRMIHLQSDDCYNHSNDMDRVELTDN